MIKFLDERIKPVKYILTPDNRLQPVTDLSDFTVDDSSVTTTEVPAITSWQPINELGKQLLKAAAEGDAQQVKSLLGRGSPFTSDWLGTSPLHLASQHNNVEVCEVLLKASFSKDVRNKVDKTPLHLAAYEGHFHIVEILIKVGADVNCRDMLNMTPLHWAVQNGHTAVAELLIRGGALTEEKNKFGLTPQDIALQINKLEIVELLQAYEGDPQTAAQTLVMQLNAENENLEVEEVKEDNGLSQIDPVIIVDDDFSPLENELEKQKNVNVNNEPVIINLCDNAIEEEEYRQDTKNKDPVIINLAKDINEEMPQISEKDNSDNIINNVTNFRIVDGVIQSSEEDADNGFSAMQLLQEHGITMLQNDNEENSILSAAVESGHSVVLTDVGKEVLQTVKQKQVVSIDNKIKPKKIITVTPQQFLSLTNSPLIKKNSSGTASYKVLQLKPNNIRRVVMKKNRVTPFGNTIKIQNIQKPAKSRTEVETLMHELAEAKKSIEEYKSKLRKKEQEVERYKTQLKLLLNSS